MIENLLLQCKVITFYNSLTENMQASNAFPNPKFHEETIGSTVRAQSGWSMEIREGVASATR